MADQTELIGGHPASPNIFEEWLECNDPPATAKKRHRSLTEKNSVDENKLIGWLSEKLIEHHYDEGRIEKLKQRYTELGYKQYAEQNRKLPRADKTQKGNITEIILIEYLEGCQNKKLIKHFKLRYNPNVDQAIKGDDVLLVDLFKEKTVDKARVFLGEAKFRGKSGKMVVKTLCESLGVSKKPLSYSFMVDALGRDPNTKAIADVLDKFLIDEIKGSGNLIYTGCLLSNSKVFRVVEKNINSDNPKFVLISIGLNNPEEIVEKAFKKAEEYVMNPMNL